MLKFANLAFLLTQNCETPEDHELGIGLSLLRILTWPSTVLNFKAEFMWVPSTHTDQNDADQSVQIRYVDNEIEVSVPNQENKARSPVDIQKSFCDWMSYKWTGSQISWRCERMNP